MNMTDLIKDPDKAKDLLKSKLYKWGIPNKEDLELVRMLLKGVGDENDIYVYLSYKKEKLDIELEKKILKSPTVTFYYIEHVIKDRWPIAEETLIKDLDIALKYASNILYGRFEKAEDRISKSSFYSLKYATEIIGGRFEKGEETISKDPISSLKYAQLIMHSKFEKGEQAISTRSDTSFIYATKILKDRFKEGEKSIMKNKTYLNNYISFLRKINKLEEFLNEYPKIKKNLENELNIGG